MDELRALPKQIRTQYGNAQLTIGWAGGTWFAGYFGESGQPEPAFMSEGITPEQAIAKLQESVDLLALWTADNPKEM